MLIFGGVIAFIGGFIFIVGVLTAVTNSPSSHNADVAEDDRKIAKIRSDLKNM